MNMVADKCCKCGRIVAKYHHSDSSDMIRTRESFLYLCDVKKDESSRPLLPLQEFAGEHRSKMWCPDCLLETVYEWVAEIKKRGPSNIPLEHVIPGRADSPSPCPICGK